MLGPAPVHCIDCFVGNASLFIQLIILAVLLVAGMFSYVVSSPLHVIAASTTGCLSFHTIDQRVAPALKGLASRARWGHKTHNIFFNGSNP